MQHACLDTVLTRLLHLDWMGYMRQRFKQQHHVG